MGKCYNHLSKKERYSIETLLKAGHSVKDIAKQLNRNLSTIYREISANKVEQLTYDYEHELVYSADVSWNRYQKKLKDKGPMEKIGNDLELLKYIEKEIVKNHYSPYAVLNNIEQQGLEFKTKICLSTCYNYIRKRLFPNLKMSDLPMPARKKKKTKVVVIEDSKYIKGISIDERPDIINQLKEIGHWEMDCVLGTQEVGKCFLVLTERMTLKEKVFLLKSHTAKEVVSTLDHLERELGSKTFRETFKSITVDNGSEFKDLDGMTKSKRNKKNRTTIYVCHPYQAGERGRNENNNRFIRRFFAKGVSLKNATKKDAKMIEDFMNEYPRPMFDGKSSEQMYNYYLSVA